MADQTNNSDPQELAEDPQVIKAIELFLRELGSPAASRGVAADKLQILISTIEKKAADATEQHIKQRIAAFRNKLLLIITTVATVMVVFQLPKSPQGIIEASYPPQEIFAKLVTQDKMPPPPPNAKPINALSPWIRREVFPALNSADPAGPEFTSFFAQLKKSGAAETQKILGLTGSESASPAQIRDAFEARWSGVKLAVHLSRIVATERTICGRTVDHSKPQAILMLPAKGDYYPWLRCGPGYPAIYMEIRSQDSPERSLQDVELVGFATNSSQEEKCRSQPGSSGPDCTYGEIQLTKSALAGLMGKQASDFEGRLVGDATITAFAQTLRTGQ